MTNRRILVIDDEAIVTRNIKLSLEKTGGFIVQTENSARRARASALQFKPDVIILDVMMPEMDGGEVAYQLQSEHLLKRVPIIYLTAIVTRTEAHGRNQPEMPGRFLAKPVDLRELVSCIEEVCSV